MPHPPRAPRLPGRAYEEAARWEWRRRDGGDPISGVTGFLAGHGFAVRPLGGTPATAAGVAGATVLLGAAALPAELALRHDPPPSPCPRVPDAAAVVWRAVDAAPDAAPDEAPSGPAAIGRWTPTWTRADHAAAVERTRAAIARGDLYQANLVAHRSAPFRGDPAAVTAALAAVPNAPYAGSLAGDGWSVHAASPESFLEGGESVVRVRPIKGTAADAATLAGSAKDRAEHVMIVDLERNDLGRVATTGTVAVTRLYDVLPRAGLWHAESTVEARLRPGTTLDQLLNATFPGGSVTGAPKRAALELIHSLEPVGRGPSMGALGWVAPDGTLDLGLSIRTFAVADGAIHLWTGGGVTWGSDAAGEVDEAEAKARPLLKALDTLADVTE